MLRVVRENQFVREFEFGGRRVLDSKYRTCELPFRSNFFISQWLASDGDLRRDMLASLSQFPRVFRREGRQIVDFLASVDPRIAADASVAMSRQQNPWSPEEVEFCKAVFIDVIERGTAAWTLAGEDRWFRVYQSIHEVRVDETDECRHRYPRDAELAALANSLPEGLHRWAIEMVRHARQRRRRDATRKAVPTRLPKVERVESEGELQTVREPRSEGDRRRT